MPLTQIHNVSRWYTQISERQHDPWVSGGGKMYYQNKKPCHIISYNEYADMHISWTELRCYALNFWHMYHLNAYQPYDLTQKHWNLTVSLVSLSVPQSHSCPCYWLVLLSVCLCACVCVHLCVCVYTCAFVCVCVCVLYLEPLIWSVMVITLSLISV